MRKHHSAHKPLHKAKKPAHKRGESGGLRGVKKGEHEYDEGNRPNRGSRYNQKAAVKSLEPVKHRADMGASRKGVHHDHSHAKALRAAKASYRKKMR